MKIDIETLRKTKGIGSKTLERIIEQHEVDNNIKSFESEYIPSSKYKTDKNINLWQGDCLELMSHIPDKSVDMILADLPYGTTACSWDTIIPFEPLWSHYKRIIKDNGAIVLFGSEPFSTKLRMSNLDWYKYDWVWDKVTGTGHLVVDKRPLQATENITVFAKNKYVYHPQMRRLSDKEFKNKVSKITKSKTYKSNSSLTGKHRELSIEDRTNIQKYSYAHPNNILRISKFAGECNNIHRLHPTQKPVPLLEYLIKTYTNEGVLVLDNVMGSGSTGVACKNLNRKFIGIELDKKYFKIAKERIENAK